MMQWLRRRFITGFFVMVPLLISLAALIWIFGVVDGITAPVYARIFDRQVPGLGILTTAAIILVVGVVATNVIGNRLLVRGEGYLLRIPVFRTVYAPIKQLVLAFSPDNEYGFKRVVLVHSPTRGSVLGFLTKEFTLDRGQGLEELLAVYVPTNHLYLGDLLICSRDEAVFPDISVQEGIRIFLTGGMALPGRLRLMDEELRQRAGGDGRRFSDKVTGRA